LTVRFVVDLSGFAVGLVPTSLCSIICSSLARLELLFVVDILDGVLMEVALEEDVLVDIVLLEDMFGEDWLFEVGVVLIR